MAQTTLIAFDFGTQKIGVAFGQTLTDSARPIECLKAQGGKPDWQALTALITLWNPSLVVVGLPLNLDGTESELSQLARKFARRLSHKLNRPITLIDERLSSITANSIISERNQHRAIKKKKSIANNIDAWAAVVIAKTWISQQQSAPNTFEVITPGQRSET